MRSRCLISLAIAAAVVIWSPLAIYGIPFDTHDGFLHIGWSVGWHNQVKAGWIWPTWTELEWGGAGSSAFLVYPPLFRQVAGLLMLTGIEIDRSIAIALLMILLINNLGACFLARVWLTGKWWQVSLIIMAALNPYLLINIYVRGAWPEACAQAMLWWLSVGLVFISRRRKGGWLLSGAAIAGIILSNWNVTLIAGLAWLLAAVLVLDNKGWWNWCKSCCLGLGITAPFWFLALRSFALVRPPTPNGLHYHEFFWNKPTDIGGFSELLWIQVVVISAGVLLRFYGWNGKTVFGYWGLAITLLGIGMTLRMSEPIYDAVEILKKIQFPWRWLSLGWFGGILWVCSAGTVSVRRSRRSFSVLLLGTALTSIAWGDSLLRFRHNLWSHAPTKNEVRAMRKMLKCDPLLPCPEGIKLLPKDGELAKRFVAMEDGRVAMSAFPDYVPKGIPETSWNKRLQVFWVPNWSQNRWLIFNGDGIAKMIKRSPTERTISVDAKGAGELRIMQWASDLWQVEVTKTDGSTWVVPDGGRDAEGWISIRLEEGQSMVRLSTDGWWKRIVSR